MGVGVGQVKGLGEGVEDAEAERQEVLPGVWLKRLGLCW